MRAVREAGGEPVNTDFITYVRELDDSEEAHQRARREIRVNAVRPGFIHTDIHASGGEPNRVQRLASSIPMRRGGTSEEVAHAILWLLSGEASYCTGSFIDRAGGR